MRENETILLIYVLKKEMLVAQSCLTFWGPVDYSPPNSSVHGINLGKTTGVGSHSLLQGIEPASSALAANSLPLSHQGIPSTKSSAGCRAEYPPTA